MRDKRALDAEWLEAQFASLTVEITQLKVAEWAEQKRYLPPSVTTLPGYFSFDVTPYLREIVNNLGVDSPVREVTVMKGAQIAFTTGVAENFIGYAIDYVGNAAIMYLTANADLAKLRLESSILPMIHHAGLDDLICSTDDTSNRKTGRTSKRLDFRGGGMLVPYGAKNADKLRQTPYRFMVRDEIDTYPLVVGKDGDPIKLSGDRTSAYEETRKVLNLSTPLVDSTSRIKQRFVAGDQRYYFVRCLKCGFPQVLRWRRNNPETGEVTGIVWETEGDRLVPGSVRYLCKECSHPHTNDDKIRLLSPANGAEWRPTAEATEPFHRSYQISAIYSPVGMASWEAGVQKWLEAWDERNARVKDPAILQVFYNNFLGVPYEQVGEKLRFEKVSAHRRTAYHYGQVPNKWALQYCGSSVLIVTCTVDVHRDELIIAVQGWTRDSRLILLDYGRFQGDPSNLQDASTWGALRTRIETKEYTADDGRQYRIALTFIDSGFLPDTVYQFCQEYDAGVHPIKGRDTPTASAQTREFSEFTTGNSLRGYTITVNFYKDRWRSALQRSWDGHSVQPFWHFNAPVDATDAQLKELTVEVKRERIDDRTNKRLGFEWFCPKGAPNELWDLTIYGNAALDLIAWNYCTLVLKTTFTNWAAFWDACESERLFFSEGI